MCPPARYHAGLSFFSMSLLRCVSPQLAHLLRAGLARLNVRERYYIPRQKVVAGTGEVDPQLTSSRLIPLRRSNGLSAVCEI